MILSYDIFIFYSLTTLSVPLTAELLEALEKLVKAKKMPNKAAAMREALRLYLEDQAVQDVLRASKEPTLRGKLDDLARKL